jgi:hypothetical protein
LAAKKKPQETAEAVDNTAPSTTEESDLEVQKAQKLQQHKMQEKRRQQSMLASKDRSGAILQKRLDELAKRKANGSGGGSGIALSGEGGDAAAEREGADNGSRASRGAGAGLASFDECEEGDEEEDASSDENNTPRESKKQKKGQKEKKTTTAEARNVSGIGGAAKLLVELSDDEDYSDD